MSNSITTFSNASVIAWLDEWANAIQSRDFEKGKALFHASAGGFGTVTELTEGLDDLVDRQWRQVWPRTCGFQFDKNKTRILTAQDGTLACVQAIWHSFRDVNGSKGAKRTGRASIILQRSAAQDPWLGVHTHFSMWPGMADIETFTETQKTSGARTASVLKLER